jgi:hypothetical protein
VARIVVFIHDTGHAEPHGAVVLDQPDSADPLVLIAEGATAACADSDGDGAGGLSRLTVSLVDVKHGDEIVGTVTPRDGRDITESGQASLVLIGERFTSVVDVVVRWRGGTASGTR